MYDFRMVPVTNCKCRSVQQMPFSSLSIENFILTVREQKKNRGNPRFSNAVSLLCLRFRRYRERAVRTAKGPVGVSFFDREKQAEIL